MSLYIRILGTSNPDIHIDEILEGLDKEGLDAHVGIPEGETPERWTYFELINEKDVVLANVERNAIVEGDFGKEELDEFRESILEFQPASAANWLNEFFDRVKVIYAFELFDEGMEGPNYPIITSTQSIIWNKVGGILQADEEGFSNEDGYHILWQFADDVEGEWNCAVLNNGKWENFSMELSNEAQRAAFLEGKVPEGATRIK